MAMDEELDSPPPHPKSKLMPIFLIVNSVLMVGLVALQFLKPSGEEAEGQDKQAAAVAAERLLLPATAGPMFVPADKLLSVALAVAKGRSSPPEFTHVMTQL